MNKPLHKDPSFWIVVVVLAGTANVLLFQLGFPWFAQRLAQSKPAPRSPLARETGFFNEDPNLDMGKKTYPWQSPRFSPQLLNITPQVVIIPTEYQPPSGGWTTRQNDKVIGVRIPSEFVVQSAYDWTSRSRMVWESPIPQGQFDFIANLPTGALEALRGEVKKQWGLVATRELRRTNVVVLKLDHAGAPGLKPVASPDTVLQRQAGGFRLSNVPVPVLVNILESMVSMPVIDETGLTGNYDIQIPEFRPNMNGNSDPVEAFRKVFLEQLGVDLAKTNATVEMLVVRKANE